MRHAAYLGTQKYALRGRHKELASVTENGGWRTSVILGHHNQVGVAIMTSDVPSLLLKRLEWAWSVLVSSFPALARFSIHNWMN